MRLSNFEVLGCVPEPKPLCTGTQVGYRYATLMEVFLSPCVPVLNLSTGTQYTPINFILSIQFIHYTCIALKSMDKKITYIKVLYMTKLTHVLKSLHESDPCVKFYIKPKGTLKDSQKNPVLKFYINPKGHAKR